MKLLQKINHLLNDERVKCSDKFILKTCTYNSKPVIKIQDNNRPQLYKTPP